MPSSCHGCFGISFSRWPPGALLASVFKGNVGTGRPYCLCHESLLASSALLFSALNGEIRSGGDWESQRPEEKQIGFRLLMGATKAVLPTWRCALVSPLCFFSLTPLQAQQQPMDWFLNVLFVLFKMQHSESLLEGSSSLVGSLLPEQEPARQGKAKPMPSQDHTAAAFLHGTQLYDGMSRAGP